MQPIHPKGKFTVKIIGQGFGMSAKGNPNFFLEGEVQKRHGPDGELEDCPPHRMTYRQYLNTETGANILKEDLGALGVQLDYLEQLHQDDPNHVSLAGTQLTMVCDHEAYNGRQYERWSIPRGQKKLGRKEVQEVGDRFGPLFRGAAKPTKSPPPAAANNSDEPF